MSSRSAAVMFAATAALSCAEARDHTPVDEPLDPGGAPGVQSTSASVTAPPRPSYTLFESGQVRPLAMSPDKRLLFVVNTPDNRLEVFRVAKDQLTHTLSIPVGLEPVAVA